MVTQMVGVPSKKQQPNKRSLHLIEVTGCLHEELHVCPGTEGSLSYQCSVLYKDYII